MIYNRWICAVNVHYMSSSWWVEYMFWWYTVQEGGIEMMSKSGCPMFANCPNVQICAQNMLRMRIYAWVCYDDMCV